MFITVFTTARHLSLSSAQMNVGHTLPSYIPKTHFNIILRSRTFFKLVSFPKVSRPQPFTHPPPRTCHMPRPFDQPNCIKSAVQTMKLLSVQFSPVSCYLLPLRPTHRNSLSPRSQSLNITATQSKTVLCTCSRHCPSSVRSYFF